MSSLLLKINEKLSILSFPWKLASSFPFVCHSRLHGNPFFPFICHSYENWHPVPLFCHSRENGNPLFPSVIKVPSTFRSGTFCHSRVNGNPVFPFICHSCENGNPVFPFICHSHENWHPVPLFCHSRVNGNPVFPFVCHSRANGNPVFNGNIDSCFCRDDTLNDFFRDLYTSKSYNYLYNSCNWKNKFIGPRDW